VKQEKKEMTKTTTDISELKLCNEQLKTNNLKRAHKQNAAKYQCLAKLYKEVAAITLGNLLDVQNVRLAKSKRSCRTASNTLN